jgi:hypothetical protein
MAAAALLSGISPAHAGKPAHVNYPSPGVVTPFVCIQDDNVTGSATIANSNYGGRRVPFITATLDDTDFSKPANNSASGAIVDGLDGIPFTSFSVDVLNSSLPIALKRVRVKFFGNASDSSFISENLNLSDATQTAGSGNMIRQGPPSNYTRFTFTSDQLGTNFAQINHVYIELRPNKNNTDLGPLTFGFVLVNNNFSFRPNISFRLTGCPQEL